MSTANEVLREIEAFLKRHGIAATAFGQAACRDPHLVRYLRNGGGITSTRIDTVREFMRTYRPKRQREMA